MFKGGTYMDQNGTENIWNDNLVGKHGLIFKYPMQRIAEGHDFWWGASSPEYSLKSDLFF